MLHGSMVSVVHSGKWCSYIVHIIHMCTSYVHEMKLCMQYLLSFIIHHTHKQHIIIFPPSSNTLRYASGATIQVLLFGVLAISLKDIAPSAHTMCEIVRARWGKSAHITFLFFAFCANIIVTSMLLLGGAATVEALTGMKYELASFLIPWGVILYTSTGGLKATFMASYLHTMIIFAVLITMITIVYIKVREDDVML